jgi:hypothetical protein
MSSYRVLSNYEARRYRKYEAQCQCGCGEWFIAPVFKSVPKYLSSAHRQRAYRRRRKEKLLHAEE